MASALSVDLRERVVVAIEAGASRREAARRFEVSPANAACTISDLWDTIQRAFRRFTPAECRRYLAATGYDTYDPT